MAFPIAGAYGGRLSRLAIVTAGIERKGANHLPAPWVDGKCFTVKVLRASSGLTVAKEKRAGDGWWGVVLTSRGLQGAH